MKPQKQRAFTASRIVALTVIGLLVLGLGYLRFSADAPVSVPHGAKAGDLHLHACHYDTEAGSYAADCGTLIVPENRADPSSRLIAVEITRIKARSGSLGRAGLPPPGRPRHHEHDVRNGLPLRRSSRRRPRRLPRHRQLDRASTAPRSPRRCSTPPTGSPRSRTAPTATACGRAPTGSPRTASTLTGTRSSRRSTISRPRARRSATSGST